MASRRQKSQSLEQFEQLEELIRHTEADLASDMEVKTTCRESGVKREEEMEAEFFDLLKTLILELNDVETDVRTPPGEGDSPPRHVPHVEMRSSQTISSTRDAATQTEKKRSKCTIL